VHTVQVKNVRKAFGSFKVLQGLNLNFVDNAVTTILGPSGTGKSVLLKHIVGLLAPESGEVIVFDQNIWKISEVERQELRKRFGVLFQDGRRGRSDQGDPQGAGRGVRWHEEARRLRCRARQSATTSPSVTREDRSNSRRSRR
jgi:ABC-type oligopeptide transport system ATPase subunit